MTLSGSGTLTSRMMQIFSAGGFSTLYVGMAIIVGVFLSIQPRLYRYGILHLFPPGMRGRAEGVLNESIYTLRWWIVAKAIGMGFVGVFVGVALWIVNLPLALPLGVIAGLLDFIPNIGAILSVIPAALLAILYKPALVVYVIFVYTAAHSLDNYVILPLLQLRFVRLAPALTLSSQLLLGYLLGSLGLVFAVPLTALVLALIKSIYLRESLSDPRDRQER